VCPAFFYWLKGIKPDTARDIQMEDREIQGHGLLNVVGVCTPAIAGALCMGLGGQYASLLGSALMGISSCLLASEVKSNVPPLSKTGIILKMAEIAGVELANQAQKQVSIALAPVKRFMIR